MIFTSFFLLSTQRYVGIQGFPQSHVKYFTLAVFIRDRVVHKWKSVGEITSFQNVQTFFLINHVLKASIYCKCQLINMFTSMYCCGDFEVEYKLICAFSLINIF